jgi:ferric-dicitrate binding protein FerR (iron transport regulator)
MQPTNYKNNEQWISQAERIVDMLLTDDNIPAEDLEMVLSWLIADDGHSEQKAEILVDKFTKLMRRGENRKDAIRLWPQLAARLDISPKRKVHKPLYRQAAFRIAAVAIPVVMMVAGALVYFDRPADTPVAPAVAMTTLSVPADTATFEKIEYTLPDRSRVLLANGSTLRYSDNFEQERHVELDGEAHFYVTKTDNNFEVRAEDLTISVLGTMFRVDGHAGEIDLYHGSVDVDAGGNHILMTPGQHLSYNHLTGLAEVTKIPLPDLSYAEMPGLSFENVRLADVFATVERDYGVHFHVDSTAVEGQEIWGDFTHFASIDEFMSMLQKISGQFTYEITTDTVIIRGV